MTPTRFALLVTAAAAAVTTGWAALCVWAVTTSADAELYDRDDLR
ncbi:hypothetical protein [Pseudonocardia sp. NPDC049635]